MDVGFVAPTFRSASPREGLHWANRGLLLSGDLADRKVGATKGGRFADRKVGVTNGLDEDLCGAAADQAIIPSEVVVQVQVEQKWRVTSDE